MGIIDVGFEGFRSLMGTELPASVEARCYTDVGVFTSSLTNCEVDSKHGSAVTEAVFDIAPEATYYIAHPMSWGDLKSTVEWMVDHDVDVINMSMTWSWEGPGDGTSPYTSGAIRSVDTAIAGGITWVNSAGNYTQGTWFGPFTNSNSNSWHEFSPGDECNNILELEAEDKFTVQLRWNDTWGGAARDLDLYLIPPTPGGSFFATDAVAVSENEQSGDAAHIPFEWLEYTVVSAGVYCLAVSHNRGTAPSWIQLQARKVPSLEHHTIHHSIGNPAESRNPGLLAVGAAGRNYSLDNPFDTNIIEPFSSQGPAPDGRIKPDIVGADAGQSVTYRSERNPDGYFFGTSQASPHVAGLAALVKQRFPEKSPQQLAQYLKNNAEARGAVPNNIWGHGFARLPASDASTPTPSPTPEPTATPTAIDKEALVAFYNATNGAGWTDNTNWLNDSVPLSSWHGVQTDADGRISALSLPGNNLTGSLPAELGSLTNLRGLYLGYNELSGTIPVELSNLANLTALYFGFNELTGTIPTEIGGLTNLKWLHLDNNNLTGAIPPELGNLSSMRAIYLQGNQLTGALPQTFTQLASLEVFAFDNGDAGLCAPIDEAFQSWLQGISNQGIATGVDPLGPNCTPEPTPSPSPTPVPTTTPTPEPTATPPPTGTPAPTATATLTPTSTPTPESSATPTPEPTAVPTQPAVPPEVLNRISALETLVATLQGLISTLESKITALGSRVTALETTTSAPTPIPTATLTPTPTTVPGTPIPTPTPAPAQPTPTVTATPIPTATPVTVACVTPITGDGVITASWIDTCQSTNRPLHPNKPDDGTYYARYYTFDITAPSTVTISLESSEDTFLYLLNGTGKTGQVAHFNDDIEVRVNSNSRIEQTLGAGSYTIEAATYKSGIVSSSFTLTVSGIE